MFFTFLLILHQNFIIETDIKTDIFKIYTVQGQEIGYYDVDILTEIRNNIGLITSLAQKLQDR